MEMKNVTQNVTQNIGVNNGQSEDLYYKILGCNKCSIRAKCYAPVPWSGPRQARVLFMGDKPGKGEDMSGRPWSVDSPAGQEFTDLYLNSIGLKRHEVRVSNVHRCYVNSESDITNMVRENCWEWTVAEIEECQPEVIVAMGGPAIQTLLGDNDITVEDSSGIPVQRTIGNWQGWVFPVANPAFGMRSSEQMKGIYDDFQKLGKLLNGTYEWIKDSISESECRYEAWGESVELLWNEMVRAGNVSMDTETLPDGTLWCATVCWEPGTAWLLDREQVRSLGQIMAMATVMKSSARPTIWMHNSPFDIPVLKECGLDLEAYGKFGDTIVIPYMLNIQFKGLKTLAKQLCGMDMRDYMDVIRPYQEKWNREYIYKIRDWGFEKPGKGTSVSSKAKAAITKYEKGTAGLDKCWKNWEHHEEVEEALGPYKIISLADVPWEEAKKYACRDADATERIRRKLMEMLRRNGRAPHERG